MFSVTLSKMPPWTNNGGSLAAMHGKGCVAIATDYYPGDHKTQPDMPDAGFKNVFKVTPRIFLGLSGLQLDILAIRDRALKRHTESELGNCNEMGPQQFSISLSNLLFGKRAKPYYVESVVAGMETDLEAGTVKPYICYIDWIGCRKEVKDFVVAGTCASELSGMCGYQWKPDLPPEDLYKVLSSSFSQALAAKRPVKPDTTALIYLIEADKITERIVEVA